MRLVADPETEELVTGGVDQLGQRVGLAGVLDGLDRHAGATVVPGVGPEATGFGWDREDSATRDWWPQGLTTAADSGHPGVAGRRIVVSAWYAKRPAAGAPATRISVIDLDPEAAPRYAHVALVAPHRDQRSGRITHRPVPVHAGGLAWFGDRLLVADTRHGVRVFRLDDVVRTAPGRLPGFDLALPQSGVWRAGVEGDARPLRWSFLSLDRTEPGAVSLVAGEYVRGDGARLARWALDHGTGTPTRTAADEVLRTDLRSMQGAVRVQGTYVLSASQGAYRRGQLWTGTGERAWTRHRRALPVGPEDLAYDPVSDRLWTQTEYPGRRRVLALPLAPILSPGARR